MECLGPVIMRKVGPVGQKIQHLGLTEVEDEELERLLLNILMRLMMVMAQVVVN